MNLCRIFFVSILVSFILGNEDFDCEGPQGHDGMAVFKEMIKGKICYDRVMKDNNYNEKCLLSLNKDCKTHRNKAWNTCIVEYAFKEKIVYVCLLNHLGDDAKKSNPKILSVAKKCMCKSGPTALT